MYNKRYIIPGVIFFVAVFTFPFWFNVTSKEFARPAVVLPVDQKECIEPVAFMQSEHMRILNEWRDAALREGKRSYTATNGKIWEVSLQNTCMKCHTDKAQFCDTCHNANSVDPYCWDCHIAPETVAAKPPANLAAGGKKP
ncbi:sulfate reduction electron transfer complex DsrMKJOP subunit DsrJ [Desulfovibrio sp. OttesenSCG-928-O18]|nr:sulfate reduction electron transfer complex DsrMKJOP subunit DsrJ [Desulfovibrio sp. OttesenSCG-928-O18]